MTESFDVRWGELLAARKAPEITNFYMNGAGYVQLCGMVYSMVDRVIVQFHKYEFLDW